MKKRLLAEIALSFTMLIFSVSMSSQVILNEVGSSNTGAIADEDGDFSDWIELLNPSASPVNVAGWSLSDNAGNWNKWLLPDISLAPGERRLVFASGKDRNALNSAYVPPTDHWETALFDNNPWFYFVGSSAPQATWKTDVSNAAGWASGNGGFGYGDGDDNTVVPNGTISVYYRKTFNVSNQGDLTEAILNIDYDDAFIAYLNGIEIARNGISGFPDNTSASEIDHEAVMYGGGDPESFDIDYTALQAALIPGNNILAIEIHNVSNSSSDLTGRTWIHFGIGSATTYFFPNPSWFNVPPGGSNDEMHTNFKISYGETVSLYNAQGVMQDNVVLNVQAGHTRARIPDGVAWCYSNNPTPGAVNTGTCYSGYANPPVVVPASGFYPSTIVVSMSGVGVRYTQDGDPPAALDPLYTTPFSASTTRVVRARSFQAGKLPSAVVTRSYFINDPTTLPVVSVIAHSGDLFNDGTGGPAVYDNASGFTQAETTGGTIQFFDATHAFKFESNTSITPVGNWSLDFAQKSLQFKYDEEYGATGDIAYNVFGYDKPYLGPSHGFRIRNTDDDWGPQYGTGARMRDLIANRMALTTHSGTAGYQNAAVFINGDYWGHYACREMLNEYFMKDNYGANPDSVIIVKTAFPGMDYVAEEGTTDSFFEMSDFLINNDMSVPANFEQASNLVDIYNWVDYWADEVYNNNADWFPSGWFNNTRIACSPSDNIKWKYVLWDVGYSQGNGSWVGNDLLYQALAAPANSNRHTDMMVSLLNNLEFRNYFINRFADLLNWHWTTENVHEIIDQCAAEMGPEIDRQNDRWGSGDFDTWSGYVEDLKWFHEERPAYQRDHIEGYFELQGQVDVTLQVSPAGAGYVKISTIIPDVYPWSGVYFNGNPVQVTAIANPGYTFVNWNSNAFISNLNSTTFNANITTNTTFTANFSGSAAPATILISEINYNSDNTRPEGDWIELYNSGSIAIDLSDWIFRDQNVYNTFVIPTGTIIGPGGHLVLCDDLESFTTEHPGVVNAIGEFDFDLANSGETISLLSHLGAVITSFAYDDISPWPNTPDGHGRTLERNIAASNPALASSWYDGCMGGSPGQAYSACPENPSISEINYKSSLTADAGDWLELHNLSDSPLNISLWTLADQNGNTFVIPDNTVLNGGQYVVLYQDATLFFNRFPGIVNGIGPFVFGYSGDGDVIKIYDETGRLFSSLCYNDTAPWPLSPDGGGYTLERLNESINPNVGINWFAGCLEGSPGGAYDPACPPWCAVYGCNDPAACNFVSDLVCDDGSCTYPGCNNPIACNFDPSAGCDNGSCTLPGCNNSQACNYNATAGCDDGSCTFIVYYLDSDHDTFGDPLVTGNYCNSPPSDYVSNNSDCDDTNPVIYPGAPGTGQGIDNNCNGSIDPGENSDCVGDFNNDGVINTSDLLLFIAEYGCTSSCTADLNNDSVVNTSDLLLFMAIFGTYCP